MASSEVQSKVTVAVRVKPVDLRGSQVSLMLIRNKKKGLWIVEHALRFKSQDVTPSGRETYWSERQDRVRLPS